MNYFVLPRSANLLQMCWSWNPLDRPTAERIVQILSETPELVQACVGVPATTVDDNSTGKFDATKAATHAQKIAGAPSSEQAENVSAMPRLKHSFSRGGSNIYSLGIGKNQRHPAMLRRKSSVQF